jgi:hypothetical protein
VTVDDNGAGEQFLNFGSVMLKHNPTRGDVLDLLSVCQSGSSPAPPSPISTASATTPDSAVAGT